MTLRQRHEVLPTLARLPGPPVATNRDHSRGRALRQANRMFLEDYGNEVTPQPDPTATGGHATRDDDEPPDLDPRVVP